MDTLLLFGLLAGMVWFWADGARAREQMLKRCRSLCEDMNLQLLDQTVSLTKLRVARGERGSVELRRWYAFEYSTDGADRWQGAAQLRGREVKSIHMAHPQGPIIIRDDARLNHH